MAAVGEPSGVTRAAGDARAVRLSRPVRAAALLRRNSRLCRRLAAPSSLVTTGTSRGSRSREKRTETTRIEPPPTESTSATSAVMAVVLAVGLAAL